MVTLAHDNPYPSVLMVEGDPEALEANPSALQKRLAVGADHLLYLVDDAGAATMVVGDGTGLPTADPAVAGLLWIDTAADFVVKQSQG